MRDYNGQPLTTFEDPEVTRAYEQLVGNRIPMSGKFTSEEYFEFVREEFERLLEIIKAKNSDYTNGAGPFANFEGAEEFGIDRLKGLFLRMSDKWQRIKSFAKQGGLKVKGESIKDALRDNIGYSLLALAMVEEDERNESIK